MTNIFVKCLVSLGSVLVFASLWAGETPIEKITRPVPQSAFDRCQFKFLDTAFFQHVTPKTAGPNYRLDSWDSGCNVHLTVNGFSLYGNVLGVSILDPEGLDKTVKSQGFYKSQEGMWKFKGNPVGITFVSFKKLSFEERKTGNEVMLIGRQLERSKDQVGSTVVFETVRILRITPTYLVSVDVPFADDTPIATRDAALKDLINMVNSVHVTSP